MGYKIINKVSSKYVPQWGNKHQYIAIHYLGVDGQNYELAPDGTGAHYTIYWDGTIYQRCSHDAIVWAVGTAGTYTQKHPQARNNNTISIELCCHCDGNKSSAEDPYWYFTEETQQAAVWLVQKLMKELGIPIGNVLRHYDIVNKVCPAPYVRNNQYKTSWTWNEFLRKLQPAAGIPASKQDFINKVSEIAVRLWDENRILPSVVIAQACLESGFGLGADALVLTKVSNILGMVEDLINGTWAKFSYWNGKIITKPTKEYINGKWITKERPFRAYSCYEECLRDYEAFLLHVRNDMGYKYRTVQGLTDPLMVITAISRGGYATDPAYVEKVMRVIEENNLTKYDPVTRWYRVAKDYKDGQYISQDNAYEVKANAIARAKETGLKAFDPDGKQIYPEPRDHYAVRRRWGEKKYQLGLFSDLERAKSMADSIWGYRVYDLDKPKKAIYKPKLARWQKLCAACVRINQWLVDDIKAGKPWQYFNDSKHRSEGTFWNTRKVLKFFTNCMGGVAFAMKESGLPASACSWYGQKGGTIRWLNNHAEADLRKYADLIKIGDRTPRQLVADGTLCPGDILTFVEINHTCIYLGNGLSYDSGHAYCIEKGEGAHFIKWIGPLSWPTYHVGYIIRLKG